MIVGPKTRQAFYFKGDSALLAQADITAWNNFASGRSATLAQVNNLIVNSRLISGALPLDFFHIQLPEGFATTNANSFDITTLQGLKLYRLRQAYDTNFGALNAAFSQPRYIQFGVRIFF